jgi:hypothetical protein
VIAVPQRRHTIEPTETEPQARWCPTPAAPIEVEEEPAEPRPGRQAVLKLARLLGRQAAREWVYEEAQHGGQDHR